MSCDHELANEWACCSRKNASYITMEFVNREQGRKLTRDQGNMLPPNLSRVKPLLKLCIMSPFACYIQEVSFYHNLVSKRVN